MGPILAGQITDYLFKDPMIGASTAVALCLTLPLSAVAFAFPLAPMRTIVRGD